MGRYTLNVENRLKNYERGEKNAKKKILTIK